MRRLWHNLNLSLLLVCGAIGQDLDNPASLAGLSPMAVAPAGDGCGSGGLTFSWHCETDNVTTGTPAGCVVSGGDGEPTYTGNAKIDTEYYYDGTHSLLISNANRYATFDAPNVIGMSEGKVVFWVMWTNTVALPNDASAFFDATVDSDTRIAVGTRSTGAVRITVYPDGTAITATTGTGQLTQDVWHKVTARWKVGGSPTTFSVQVDSQTEATSSTAIAFTGTLATYRLGETGSSAVKYWMDAVQIGTTSGL